tara:strand:- start:271 stop:573 length:303 start_codon:yes stop_codon:yes gene_type:complete
MFDNIDLTWAPPILAMLGIVAAVAGMIRWLVKHYFDEIRAEFKPNGGGSMKDAINRLEVDHKKVLDKVAKVEAHAAESHKELSSKVDKIYSTIIAILKDR